MQSVMYFDCGNRTTTRINSKGNATRAAKRVFSCGQCHALALALHEATGLPLFGLWYDYEGPEDATPSHVVVKWGDTFVDIEGPGAENRWSMCEPFPVTKADVENYKNRDYLPPNKAVAKPFAAQLLKKYGIQPFKIQEEI